MIFRCCVEDRERPLGSFARGNMAGDAGSAGIAWAKGVLVPDEDAQWIVAREAQVLGAVMLRPEGFSDLSRLDPLDFCVSQYRESWRVIRAFALAAEFHKINPLSVAQGAAISSGLLIQCISACGSPISAPDYAREMIAARALREAMIDARRAMRETNPAIMAQALQRAARTVAEVRSREEFGAKILSTRFLDRFSAIAAGQMPQAPSTGLPTLDARIGGLVPENLVVLAGRPGMGKTVTTISIARQAAKLGSRIGYFSLEIGEAQFSARIMADECYDRFPPYKRPFFGALMKGVVSDQLGDRDADEWLADAAEAVGKLPIYTSFTAGVTLAEIDSTISRWEDEAGAPLDAVVIDYSAFVKDSGSFKNNANKQVGEIFLDMKMLARRRKTCVVGVHQLNRGVEQRDDKRPNMGDLRDSGEIEQHADTVALLYREEYYLSKVDTHSLKDDAAIKHQAALEACRGKLEIIADKNRSGEPGRDIYTCAVASNALRELPK